MTNYEFAEKARKKVDECWAKLEKRHNKTVPVPSVDFRLRGRSAGTARLNNISLNLNFVKSDADDMLNQTVPHEVVHAFLFAINDPSHVRSVEAQQTAYMNKVMGYRTRMPKREPHGYTFMNNLAFLGGDQKRTHSYSLEGTGITVWKYKCPRCGIVFELSTRKHNQIVRGNPRWHTKCGPSYPLERVR